jgi:hypothetical protein
VCAVNYTVTFFKSSNIAKLPIVNFHFVIVTRPTVSPKTLCMFVRRFHTFNYTLFYNIRYLVWWGNAFEKFTKCLEMY